MYVCVSIFVLENNPVSICMAVNRSYLRCIVVAVVTLSVCMLLCCVQNNGSSAQYNTESNQNGRERESKRVEMRVICDSFPVNCRSIAMSKYFH